MGRLLMEQRSTHPFRFAVFPVAVLMTISSCSSDWREPPPITSEEFTTEHEEWRSNREQQ